MFAHLASLLLLSFAVSLDGFGVGVTYGLRRIRIPIVSVIIIACLSGLVIGLSMAVGGLITEYLSPVVARMIGASILIAIGLWALLQLKRNREQDRAQEEAENEPAAEAGLVSVESEYDAASGKTLVSLELKQLGIVIQILRKPQVADVDKSGSISASEALLLGVALSFDAFGAGLGAAMIGLQPTVTAVVIALSSAVFLIAGMRVGFKYAGWRGMQTLSALPGMMLIVMGIIKLF